MTQITLTEPIATDRALQRLQLFPGRHLGEEEFDRQQAYADRRVAPLLATQFSGVIEGLDVRSGHQSRLGDTLTVSPGLATAGNGLMLGLFYPLRQTWTSLIQDYLDQSGANTASGIYYLVLKRSNRYIDSEADVKPCQRQAFDPTRDARRVLVGSLCLKRLAIHPEALNRFSREALENWVAANNVDGTQLKSMINTVPLGLLAITPAMLSESETEEEGESEASTYQVQWFSQAAGRYEAIVNSGYQVLLAQVREAFDRLTKAAEDSPENLISFLNTHLQLPFLPAAGQLPQSLIHNIAESNPSLGWLPNHLQIDMVAVPEDGVQELIERHLPRRAIDLREPSGEHLRLLIAVPESDYSPTLLHFPQIDNALYHDIYRYFRRAYRLWASWMHLFNRLYFTIYDNALNLDEIEAVDEALEQAATTAGESLPLDPQISAITPLTQSELNALGLPQAVSPPLLPQDFFSQLSSDAAEELGAGEPPTPPYPYDPPLPPIPELYTNWGFVDENQPGNPVMPPPISEPSDNGLVIQLAIAEHEMEGIDNQVRAIRARLEKTRDYLLLQRQQLDNQTVSLSALAGGVAGDGSGLQVARWLPFTEFKRNENPSESSDETSEAQVSTGNTDNTGSSQQVLNYASFAQATPLSSFKQLQLDNITNTRKASQSVSRGQVFLGNSLRRSPNVLSNTQFTLNATALDRISSAPKQALTRPAFEAKPHRFGVLGHIRPEVQEYKKAMRGMSELITTLDDLFDSADVTALRRDLRACGQPMVLADIVRRARDDGASENPNSEELAPSIYQAMFEAGKILTKQIAVVEARYTRVEAALEGKLRSRIQKEGQIQTLQIKIYHVTEQLESLDKRREEYLGDYGLAQRLLDDDWRQAYDKTEQRRRILSERVSGLYYVRVRQAPISMPLPDPLALRHGHAGDIVPGCDWQDDPELPEELNEFFDALQEIPMADWTPLQKLQRYVPLDAQLKYIHSLRTARLASKTQRYQQRSGHYYRSHASGISLQRVSGQNRQVLSHWSRLVWPSTSPSSSRYSSKLSQSETLKVLSLEDILSGTRGKLRSEAQNLHRRLEQAVDCMLEQLHEISPSVRLKWAQLAEDDRLPLKQVARWPSLELAERDDFNATRTLVELVDWWFRQLDKQPASNSQGAMRNMLRATLIHAALGDAHEILTGEVSVPPTRLLPGERLRLKLNRQAKPGTILQLMDTQQRVVALLSVDDDDKEGTVAEVSRVLRQQAQVNTGFRISANKFTRYVK